MRLWQIRDTSGQFLNIVSTDEDVDEEGVRQAYGAAVVVMPVMHVQGFKVDKGPKTIPCPHQKIIDIYHEVLPECPQVQEWNNTRQGYLQGRWREKAVQFKWVTEEEGLKYWRKFLTYVGKSQFLTGKAESKGRAPFVANLEWICRPTNFAKIVEGNYHGQN